jgi:peptide/nickel transport system substrate-binding protein
MLAFADAFNSQKFMREKEGVVGSGPYEFSEWVTGSKLTFKKKKNWWGRNASSEYIKNYAQVSTLKFKVINDWNTTTTAIKGGELDCIKSIEFKAFNELKNDERFLKNYEKHTPSTDQYVYIGLNQSNSILKELKVRQALAHAIDKEQIIQKIL